jgi:pyruvate kinase
MSTSTIARTSSNSVVPVEGRGCALLKLRFPTPPDPEPRRSSTVRSTAAELAERLEQLRVEMRHRHVEAATVFEQVHPSHRHSTANLIDYLTLRQFDMRDIQDSLAELGLSSLGRAEEHVITTLERVLDNLHLLAGDGQGGRTESAVSFKEGRTILESNTASLLGPSRPERSARILVTMPSEAANDFALVANLIERGMDCARINCAHDDPDDWRLMVTNLRRAADEAGRPCPILMDLPGPKLRTGPIEPGPRVVRLRPKRDDWGRPTVPAKALLVSEVVSPILTSADASSPVIPVPKDWLERLRVGDRIRLTDARGASRKISVTEITEAGAWTEFRDTTYLATGTRLVAPDHRDAVVGLLPPREQALVLHADDVLTLTSDLSAATPNEMGGPETSNSTRLRPDQSRTLRIGCTSPEALQAINVGHRVFFDDGKIGSVAVAIRPGQVDVRITNALAGGSKLRAEKGINLPDSDVPLPALGPDDLRILRFVVDHADLVALSFAHSPADVVSLQHHLEEFGGADLGIVLKIETVRGFKELPEMLLAAMASERVGVMVARGDLAVECGFERLAEVQEEILWLCEAAHIPVIWATQVLDQLARTGQPSRAEISDAVMAARAECVMLNKGPHITDAVTTLDDILCRMISYQHKKVALLRRLNSWQLDLT